MKYALEKRPLPYGKRLYKDCLEEIIDDITSKHGLDSSDIYHSTIRRRKT